MAKRISNEKEKQIIDLYISGKYTLTKISEIAKVNIQTVEKYLDKNQIQHYSNGITQHQIDETIRLYSELNMSQEQVSKIVKLAIGTVRKILKSNDIHIKQQKEWLTKYYVNSNYFDEIDTPNKAYFLGFMYADGNVSKTGNTIQIALQSRDKHILEHMKVELGCEDHPLYLDERSKKNSNKQDVYQLNIKNEQLHNSLIKHGVVPNKTHICEYPFWLPDDLHRHFIRGLMDGDGCIHNISEKYPSRRGVDICGNPKFCPQLKSVIENMLSIHCSLIVVDKKRGTDTMRVTISGKQNTLKFLNWIYEDADMYLYRKYEIYKQYCENV